MKKAKYQMVIRDEDGNFILSAYLYGVDNEKDAVQAAKDEIRHIFKRGVLNPAYTFSVSKVDVHGKRINPKKSRHIEIVEGKKYYGSHSKGWVLLVNGYPEYQGTKAEVKTFLKRIQS